MPRCDEEQTYLGSACAAGVSACSRRPTKCGNGAPRPGGRGVYHHPSSWRRARIRSGPGTSPSSRARSRTSTSSLYVIGRPLQPLRRGLDGRPFHGECAPGKVHAWLAATCLKQGIAPQSTHDPCRPRRAHAEQARRAALLGPEHQRGQSFAARAKSNDGIRSSESQFRTNVKYRPDVS